MDSSTLFPKIVFTLLGAVLLTVSVGITAALPGKEDGSALLLISEICIGMAILFFLLTLCIIIRNDCHIHNCGGTSNQMLLTAMYATTVNIYSPE